jgi:protein-S-isoprenylcysteine O-methyltransferase Ste14
MDRDNYEIRICGPIGAEWADWFGQGTIHIEDGESVLVLLDADRSAFYGAMRVLGDLDRSVVSVRRLEEEDREVQMANDGNDSFAANAANAANAVNGIKTMEKMGIMGDAPRLAASLLPAFAAALTASILWPESFVFAGKAYGIALAAGIVLAVLGLVFQASAAFELIRAYGADKLAVKGAFGLCRNPIAAWWIFSVIPATGLVLNSWLLFPVAILFRILAGGMARDEEKELSLGFGEQYQAYRARVRAFLPLPRLRPFSIRRYLSALPVLLLAGLIAAGAFLFLAGPLLLRLGSTTVEAAGSLPGDEYVDARPFRYTQSIEVAAPPEVLWRWLVQVGYKRGGWYNFDAINRLAASDYFDGRSGSAERIYPGYQDLAEGDLIHLVPQLGMTVVLLDAPHTMVLVGDPAQRGGSNVAWIFMIHPLEGGTSRLLTRFSGPGSSDLPSFLVNTLINQVGGAMIQQPAMLWGMKILAEREPGK